MWCPRCGSETDEASRFCSTCGVDLATYRQLWRDTGSPAQGQTPQSFQDTAANPGPAPHSAPQMYQAPRAYQAPPYLAQGARPHVPSYMGWAIVVLLFCFMPTGIAAVVYASQVDSKLAHGDVEGALESSSKAKKWCWISLAATVFWWILAFSFIACGVDYGSAAAALAAAVAVA
jgi:hypothetical protein